MESHSAGTFTPLHFQCNAIHVMCINKACARTICIVQLERKEGGKKKKENNFSDIDCHLEGWRIKGKVKVDGMLMIMVLLRLRLVCLIGINLKTLIEQRRAPTRVRLKFNKIINHMYTILKYSERS